MTQQSCSTKIVSLHMDECLGNCPHKDVCYHLRKDIIGNGGILPPDFRYDMLERGYQLHESVCNSIRPLHLILLDSFPNYHVTLPYNLLSNDLLQFKTQLQVTVYSTEQASNLYRVQKLFLIKNEETWFQSLPMWDKPFEHIHFVVDQNWLTTERLGSLVVKRMSSTGSCITVDSCLESYLINGTCPYRNGRYIDITFDGTLRTCPFTKEGMNIPKGIDYDELFNLRQKRNCKYKKLFNGDADGAR